MIPSWSSCWLAIKLYFGSYFIALPLFTFYFWQLLIISILLLNESDVFLFFLGLSVLSLLGGFVWYVLSILVYGLILKIFWNQPPLFISAPKLTKDCLIHFGVILVSSLPIAIINTIYIFVQTSMESFIQQDIKSVYIVDFLLKTSFLWFITAVYIYYFLEKLDKKHKHKS